MYLVQFFSNLNLPHEEFDLDVTKILTRKQTNETKNNKDKFTIMKKNRILIILMMMGFMN